MWYERKFHYGLDKEHGLGILTGFGKSSDTCSCFFEDGSQKTVKKNDVDRDSSISDLINYYTNSGYYGQQNRSKTDTVMKSSTCTFAPGKEDSLEASLTYGKKTYAISDKKEGYRFGASCTCGRYHCPHICAAGGILNERFRKLKHDYIVSDLPLDKSLFLDPYLTEAAGSMENKEPDQELVETARKVTKLLCDAGSEDYYWDFHEYLLDLSPDFYEARFLEESYPYLLAALFEDPGYRREVLDTGEYAEPYDYEERQHRSNRASFKRVLKSYQLHVRELEKGGYKEDPFKEFLLKYRGGLKDLLHYYASVKAKPAKRDLPYLRQIAALPDPDISELKAAAAKLDSMADDKEALEIFRLLAGRIPADEIAAFYSGLKNITMGFFDMKKLSLEDQMKAAFHVPLTGESFTYIMDQVLAGADDKVKGTFILHSTEQASVSGSAALKKKIADAAAALPDARLLLSHVVKTLKIKGILPAPEGDPKKEMASYFACAYEFVNRDSSFYCDFTVRDPGSGRILLWAREEDHLLSSVRTGFTDDRYPPELIRKVCVEGREDAYQAGYIKNRDAVDAFLFEKKNKKFAEAYRRLCRSFEDEGKLPLAATEKARIDWLLYRSDGASCALAFKVGTSRKYVVKDASEFLQAFRTGQTSGYGKDLVLTHAPDNLEEADGAAVRLLMSARYTKGRSSDKGNKRYITVGESLFANLLEILSGRTVFYNEIPCLLRLEPRRIRLRISASYVLSADLSSSGQEFISLMGRGYLLTRQKDGSCVMDRVEGTNDEMSLIDLVCKNPSVNIKPILKDFQANVYSRFFESFDLDKKIRPQFALSELRLNTYFDLENSVITARTVILRDGKEIPAEDLSRRIDQVKLELLQNYLASLGFSDGVLADESGILSFFRLDFTRMKSLTNVYLSENLQNKELRSVGRPVIRVTYQSGLVNVFLEKSEFSQAELEKIVLGLRKKKKYIMLNGDRIVDLDSEAARDLGDAIQDFGMDPGDLYKKKTVSFITAIKAFSHQKSCRVDKYLRDMIEEIRSFKEADLQPPVLNGTLRGYQEEGFKWMSVLSRYGMGGILADDMGLGKTIQVIALIKSDETPGPSLVVCPKSLVFNWISEFARFDGTLPVRAIYGPEAARRQIISSIDYGRREVYITSYDSLRIDIDKYTGQFCYGILDEAQYIKNVHAQKTRSVKELKVRHRFALTGTPIENSVIDLWSIFDYIMPGYFEELSRFKDSPADAIARKAGPFILRRVKGDVLEDLPSKYETILSADMSRGQRKVYDAMRLEARKALEEGGKAFDILPYLTRLRQVCVDPGMFLEGYKGGSGKLEMLSELIPEYLDQGHRILVFSQFVKALDSVRALLEKKNIPFYFLSGSTSAKDRLDMMDSFNSAGGIDVFLISLKAGGTGLNLTGADTVIHLDPWWNVAAENQASDRTHRIGQTRNVEVIKLIAADSIEQRVVELQEIKKEVIKQVISDDDGSVTSARLEDIAFVLE
jgi:superfamily II DNA or RNA helicase